MDQINILVTDDEREIADLLEIYLVSDGYRVWKAYSAKEGLQILQEHDIQLAILDIMMPEMDGYEAYRRIREIKDIPALMLSAKGEEYDKLQGFEAGIDDYVVKPFSPKELMMRVSAILKRYHGDVNTRKKDIYTYEGLKIDFTARKVFIDDKEVEMSPKEYVLLFYLVRNEGIALTREQLIHDVWGYDFYGDDRTLDTHIKLLRKSLQDYSRLIITLRGVGYRFEAEK